MRPFVILGGQRSGSSFLVKLLDGHPFIRCAEEYFLLHWRDDRSGEMHVGPFASYCRTKPGGARLLRAYVKAKDRVPAVRGLIEVSVMNRWVDAFLDYRLYDAGSSGSGLDEGVAAAGFKMIYIQLERFPRVHDWIRRRDAVVIHLVRENVLRMHVSDLRAKRTGVHHLEQAMDPGKMEVPVNELIVRLQSIERQRAEHRRAIRGHRVVEVGYERLVENPVSALKEVFEVLELEPGELPEPATKRLNPKTLAETTSNFEALVAELEGTRFERFLAG